MSNSTHPHAGVDALRRIGENEMVKRGKWEPLVSLAIISGFPKMQEGPLSMAVTCVIPCKGRLHHLRKMLPKLLSQDDLPGYRVLVVDYGCPDGTFSWCQEQAHPRLDCIKVLDDTVRFHLSRARNCGNRFVETDLIVALDADCILGRRGMLRRMVRPVLEQRADVSHVSLIQADGSTYPAHTCLAYRRADWLAVGGCDEQMTGWGYEDTDFFDRMKAYGACHELQANHDDLYLIPHDDRIRAKCYAEKNVAISWQQNRDLAENRTEVNSRGFATFELLDESAWHSYDET